MICNNIKSGEITIEVNALMPEKVLNLLWNNKIYICNIIKINLTTIRFTIYYKDYKKAEALINKENARVRIIKTGGIIVVIMKMKRKLSLVIGVALFFCVMYFLSNYIWAIDIQTQRNLSPFEVRQQLSEIGIKPGICKAQINIYDLEKNWKI